MGNIKSKEDLLDEYFPKGKTKKRGEAMLLMAVTEIESRERTINIIADNTHKDEIGIGFKELRQKIMGI